MKRTSILLILAILTITQAFSQIESTKMNNPDQYTFQLSNNVTRQKVIFKNRFGITIAGDLYLPKNTTNNLAAIAISGPYGAVKEQSSGFYANELASLGFAALAFDPSYTGESSGEPRNISSADINTEDFSAAVDYLGIQKNIDRNKIGIIGICGFGGFALNATTVDKRIKAVVTTSMYDIPRVYTYGYNDSRTTEDRKQMAEEMGQQRWKDAASGHVEYEPNGLAATNDESPQFIKEYFDYYKTPRGFHERSLNSNAGWSKTNGWSIMNSPILGFINEISPRPILLIAGDNAHSRYLSEDIFKDAAEPKELLIVSNAKHVDLYDRKDKIPFAKIRDFFIANLQ